MRLTKRGEYALRAMIDLGIAQESGRPIIQISELARRENIPIKFLEAILVQLKEAGYLDSKRGKQGGYLLARPMAAITIGDVIRKVEGPLAPISCVSQNFYESCSCPDEDHCGLRILMLDVRNAIANILDRYTLAQTVEVTLRKMRRDGVPLPFASPLDDADSVSSVATGFSGGVGGLLSDLAKIEPNGQKSRARSSAKVPAPKTNSMFRKELIATLTGRALSVSNLARLLKVPPEEIEVDLRHVQKSLEHTDRILEVAPARCRKCDFVFGTDKLRKPSKCPKCRGTWLTEPRLEIVARA